MKIKNEPDFYSGIMFMATGIAFAWGATNYNIGGAGRMGPGYFPFMLGILMTLVGAGVTFNALSIKTSNEEKIGKWAWRPLCRCSAGMKRRTSMSTGFGSNLHRYCGWPSGNCTR